MKRLRGRGYAESPPGRFAGRFVVPEAESGEPARPATVVRAENARRIVSTNRSPDVPFDQSVNPYRGCEHGCVYCFARPSHSFLDLSPGLDFETRLFAKTNAAERLREHFSRPGYRCEPLALGANTDPYQPIEKRYALTREILKLLLDCRHPVTIVTKGTLIERDLDILADLADRNLCQVAVSLPTEDDDLKRTLEPRVPSAAARYRTMRRLSAAGIPVTVLVAPVIPVLTDSEFETILRHAAAAGAVGARYILLRLPHEVEPLFRGWLTEHRPLQASHVLARLKSMHAGRTYRSRFGLRQRGDGPYADIMEQRFRRACRRYGLERRSEPGLDTRQFRAPPANPRQSSFEF